MRATLFLFLASLLSRGAEDFGKDIKPVLDTNCRACHNPANTRNRIDFLKAEKAADLETNRLMWRDVATQLRNRTMPPAASKLKEDERFRVSEWIDKQLKATACSAGESAYAVAPRRLNRREYRNTIRDLFGLDFVAADLFPADESGGNGFDTNGDTLYLPPILLERYLEAAQKILDRVIITPAMSQIIASADMKPTVKLPKPGRMLAPGEKVEAEAIIFVEGRYTVRVSIERPRNKPVKVRAQIDDGPLTELNYRRDSGGGPTAQNIVTPLTRGVHRIRIEADEDPIEFYRLIIEQQKDPVPLERHALHHRLFGLEVGESPMDADVAARRLLERLLPRAYRHPVNKEDIEPFYRIYKRAAERGDPYEESVKMALRAVLVSPKFLFRAEEIQGVQQQPVAHYDMASRLSYFLWSTMPDDELLSLAAAGNLQDPKVLRAQVDRMLEDPRSRAFANSFVGQWLGTQEVGGRVVPLLTELQHYYTPEIAAELREEPVLYFQNLLAGGRSLLELIDSNYSFLTARLARFYQVEDQLKTPLGDRFQKTEWPDRRRGGVLGMASVLAMTSHYKMASPVLRGAWVLETLLGTPVPPPPPDVPPLEVAAKSEKGLAMKEILERHRANSACASCHNLMDPIGLGLEPFDWMGRWREADQHGNAIFSKGALPSGESFDGPVELRQVLLSRKEEFLRHVSGKMMGYALGRVVGDADQCTLQRIVEKLEQNQYSARVLVHEIVQSSAFRNHFPANLPPGSEHSATKTLRTRLLGDK